FVIAGGSQQPTEQQVVVGTERHASDETGITQHVEFFLAGRVAKLDGGVPAARSEQLAVRTERHAVDLAAMPLQRADFLAVPKLRVPKLDGGVPATRSQQLAVRTERHTFDQTGMPHEAFFIAIDYCF